jgi:hypothetical protein
VFPRHLRLPDAIFEVRHSGRFDHPNLFELELGIAQGFEQAGAVAQEEGGHGDIHLVDQPGGEVLLDDVGAARDRHVLAAGCLLGLLERGFDSFGDEMEGGALWSGPATKPSSDIEMLNLSLLMRLLPFGASVWIRLGSKHPQASPPLPLLRQPGSTRLVERIERLHVGVGKSEVEDRGVLLDALASRGLREHRNAALHGPPQQ